MNWLELSCSVVLQIIFLGIVGHSLTLIHYGYTRQIMLLKESMEVSHALDILTRSIQQAGFPIQEEIMPKDNNSKLKLSSKTKSNPTKQISNKKVQLAIEIGKLKQLQQGQFVSPKMSPTLKTDALIVRHGSIGHVDCLGNTIDSGRLKDGLAYQGFFLQEQRHQTEPTRFTELSKPHRSKKLTGALMCQSIDRQGRFQNDALLIGVSSFQLDKTTKIDMPSHIGAKEQISIQINMQSGKTYSKSVAMKHPLYF